MLFPRSFSLSDLAMDFIEPVFGNRCIQYMNGEEAKLRRQRYDYYMNSEFVSMYFPSFVEVSQALHTWYWDNKTFFMLKSAEHEIFSAN